MNTMIKLDPVLRAIACALCCILSVATPTHGQSIVSMTLLPAHAITDEQALTLAFQVGTPGQGGTKVPPSATRSHDTIVVEGCYYRGELTQPRTFSDTVQLGILPPGTYTLIGRALNSENNGMDSAGCRQRSRIFIDSFVVTQAPVRSLSEDILLYPSPTTGRTVKIVNRSKAVIEQVTVFNAYGQKLDEMQQPAVMNLSGLAAGIYLLHIKTDRGVLVWKQVLQ